MENHLAGANEAVCTIDRMLPVVQEQSTCRRGCWGCCGQLALTSITDGIRIATYLLAHPEIRRDFLDVHLPAHLDVLRRTEGDVQRYWDSEVRCPFLTDTLVPSCSVYEARPMPCRLHFVASDPDNCYLRNEALVVQKADLGKMEGIYNAACVQGEAAFLRQDVSECYKTISSPAIAATWGLTLLEQGVDAWHQLYSSLPVSDPLGTPFWGRMMTREVVRREARKGRREARKGRP